MACMFGSMMSTVQFPTIRNVRTKCNKGPIIGSVYEGGSQWGEEESGLGIS